MNLDPNQKDPIVDITKTGILALGSLTAGGIAALLIRKFLEEAALLIRKSLEEKVPLKAEVTVGQYRGSVETNSLGVAGSFSDQVISSRPSGQIKSSEDTPKGIA